ncbi:MAG: endonuclease [Burkholderiales bacterium PBB5]|nr:MAG: endonuclease [Burkholderiales bacterium PBB5]
MRSTAFSPSRHSSHSQHSTDVLRVATYNIHKGALVCLQEVRLYHHRDALRFDHTWLGWPEQGQAEFLAPEGYEVAYRTNAVTRGGEHGNALLSRWPIGDVGHHDVSDHRFEQRGLLHVPVRWHGVDVHVVVAHFGLIHRSRVRQVERLAEFIADEVPPGAPLMVAGDFNDWGGKLDGPMAEAGLARALANGGERAQRTFPSRVPVFALDRVYTRGLACVSAMVPRNAGWARMSDHLPLLVELRLA